LPMNLKANTTAYVGGGLLALVNHFADKQNQLIAPSDNKDIRNSELVSLGVILADVFLGNKLRGLYADILDDATGAATYRLVQRIMEAPKHLTGVGVGSFQQPAYYYQPAPAYQPVYQPVSEPAGAVSAQGSGWEVEY